MSERSPRDVDIELAQLYQDRLAAQSRLISVVDSAHRYNSETPRRNRAGRIIGWPSTTDDVIAICRAAKDSTGSYRLVECAARYDAIVAEIAAIDQAQELLDSEYRLRRWSRFFLVTSSNGHIHRDMSCSTCRPTTVYGWLPDLSGLTESDAVAAHGPLLCTVCYPAAPVEWTRGRPEAVDTCPGSGRAEVAGTWKRQGMGAYGQCRECGQNQTVTSHGLIRKHKKA